MGTTPTYSWPYPEPTDPVANGAQDIEDLALAVETTVAGLPTNPSYTDYSGSLSFTNMTLGNGTINFAYYIQIGDFVHYTGQITFGTTTSITGNVGMSLPVNANTRERGAGNCEFIDNGVGAYAGAAHANATALGIYCYDETGSFVQNNTVIATRPFTWTTNDIIAWTVVYRAA